MNDVPDRSGFYEEDPYFRTERDDPTDEDRRESLVDCLLDIAREPLEPIRHRLTVTADDLAAVTRDAEHDLQKAKAAVIEAQDYLIASLQAEIDFLEGE